MQQGKHLGSKTKQSKGLPAVILAVLVCVIFGVVLLSRRDGKQAPVSPPAIEEPTATVLEYDSEKEAELIDAPSSTPVSAVGTLLESGSDINSSVFKNSDFWGAASDLTDSSFSMGKAAMAYNSKNQLIPATTVYYGENTVVRTATFHQNQDIYEMYSSSLDEFKGKMEAAEYCIEVIVYLENPNAEELWAKEILIYKFA